MIRQVTLDSARRLKDKSVKISFTTSLEQSTDDYMEIDKLIQHEGFLYFKSSGQLTQKELKELDSVELEVGGKTKSERLRNALYVLHSKIDSGKTFEEFYSDYMNKFQKHILDQIPED